MQNMYAIQSFLHLLSWQKKIKADVYLKFVVKTEEIWILNLHLGPEAQIK